MESLVCPQCKHENKLDYRFCTHCGVRLAVPNKSDSPRLVMLHGDRPNISFYINKAISSIGRDEANTIVLHDTQISKHHAKILIGDGSFWIEDSRSKNGVFINGKKIANKEHLAHGCLLKLGSTILRFEKTPVV
jgi:pSer/pThr/pTyr-binding forkhead associated (FHA) protein